MADMTPYSPDYDLRRDPDAILRQIEAAEAADTGGRGKLKIFFGYAAGVGKTYAMLEQAQDIKKKGFDVAVGYVEPHTRADTLALLEGLEQIPPQERTYRNITLREFDLDATLKRHPQIALVDELAHTNAPGSRHKKRYQDIEELLRAGINVFTTVNVQHLEGLNDRIASITQISVAERIPDTVFDHASSVELVDIEPDDLIERLESGKIYLPERATTALHSFFTKKNLTALREIALRRMADRMTALADSSGETSRPETGDDVLVYVTPDPGNVKVIRAAAHLAEALHSRLTALVIESDARKLDDVQQKALAENISLAGEFGAQSVTLYGDDVAAQIAQYCVTAGITQVVIGSSSTVRIASRFADTLTRRLTRLSRGVNITVVPVKNLPLQKGRYRPATGLSWSWGDIGKAFVAVALASVLGLIVYETGLSSPIILSLYMLVVILIAPRAEGFYYSFAASLFCMLAYNFFFTSPRFTLHAYGLNYPFVFIFIMGATLVASSLTVRMKRQTQRATRRSYRTEVLLESSKMLQAATDVEECFRLGASQVIKLLDRPVVMYRLDGEDVLCLPEVFDVPGSGGGDATAVELTSPSEQAVAAWVAANNEAAGATTDTLREAKCLYLPIRSEARVFGVAGLVMEESSEDFGAFEKNLLCAVLDECGQTSAQLTLAQERRGMELKMERETLRSNLLRTISHDLRTPLTSISGDADVLAREGAKLSEEQRMRMYEDIYDDANWLIALVENLLAVTRIDEGTASLNLQPEVVGDVVRGALRHVNRRADAHTVTVETDSSLLMANMDARLIMQVIINLVNNALAYTPAGSHIVVSTHREAAPQGDRVLVSVTDDGLGIAPSEKAHLFDMFYNGQGVAKGGDSKRGLGLGLPLCRSIVRAHGSDIEVADAYPHGSSFSFALPVYEQDAAGVQAGGRTEG